MWRLTLHRTAHALDPARWDALGAEPFSTRDVLAALEDAQLPGVRLWYAEVESAPGRLVAAAPLARVEVDAGRLTHGLFRAGIAAARRVRPGFLRTALLLCGTPLSVGNPPVRWRPGASSGERTRALEELARAAAALADEHAAPWRAFKEFAPSELPLARAALAPAGWLLAPSEPGSALALEGPDFATYLRSLRSPYRYRLRKAARRLEQAGVRVEVAPLAAAWEPGLHALYEAVLGRAAVQLERLTPAFFAGLGRALGERALLVSFRRDGRVIGWVAMVVEGEAAYDLFHGIDYAAGADCDLYVNQIAAAIGVATERGARAFCLGQSTEEAKARFGARPAPLWVALRHRSAALTAALRAGQGVLFPERPYPLRRAFAEPARRPAASAALRRAG